MKHLLEIILSLPKSLYFNFRVLPLKQALYCPVLIHYNCKFTKLTGNITIENNIYTGMIRIGFGNVGIFDKKYSRSIIELYGHIIFTGNAQFGHGSKIIVGPNGILNIGSNFSNTAEGVIICFSNIKIGKNCATSWNSMIMDTDFHDTQNTLNQKISPCTAPINIGDNVWLCARAIILKGCNIPTGCIIGCNSVVCKNINADQFSLLAGNPATIKKRNITKYSITQ